MKNSGVFFALALVCGLNLSAAPFYETLRFNFDGAPESLADGQRLSFDLFLIQGRLHQVAAHMLQRDVTGRDGQIRMSISSVKRDFTTGDTVYTDAMDSIGHGEANPFLLDTKQPNLGMNNGNRVRFEISAEGGPIFFSQEKPFLTLVIARTGTQPYNPNEHRGDVNLDGKVNLYDLNAVRNHFGSENHRLRMFGDLDNDSFIGLSDLNEVRNNFGAEHP